MIQKDGKLQEIACDECGETTGDPFHRIEFREMVEAAKDSGWEIKLDERGEWRHYCPACREEGDPGDRLAAQLALFGRG